MPYGKVDEQVEYVHLLECYIVRETKLAFLVRYSDVEYWLPKSEIDNASALASGDSGVTISLPEWLANEKGIDA